MSSTINKVFILILLTSLSGCAGCSKSGRNQLKLTAAEVSTERGGRGRDRQQTEHEVIKAEKQPISINGTEYLKPDGTSSRATLTQLYEKSRRGVFMVFSTNDGEDGAFGSGFFITADGVGISNQHVFDGYENQAIKTFDGKIYPVKYILDQSHNTQSDYVIFKVDLGNDRVHPLPVSNILPDVGEDVFAIGNPKGLEHTLSKGIVSAYRDGQNVIQTTTEITNGSSGGPLFNMNGEVVGITTSGVGEANLNFVVNISLLDLRRYHRY